MGIYLPEWLYERTPYLYSATGGASAYWGPNKVAAVCGLLLVITAIVIVWARRRYRRQTSSIKRSMDARLKRSRPRD